MYGDVFMNEQLIKEQICDVCHRMWQLGWVAANDGNITVKLDDGNFLVTPSGTSKSFITPEILIKVDPQGNVIEGPEGYKPSSEIKMHFRCYEKRPELGAVVHAHPPVSTAFAVAHIHMDDYIMPESILSLGSVPIAPYGTPSTNEVSDGIEPFLNEHDAILLENHGALTMGVDLLTAYYRMETLELWAKISMNARLLGGAKEVSRENIDTLMDLRVNRYKLTGNHPGYKKYNK